MAGKLTEEQRQEIGRRYEAGEDCPQLARVFGVSKSTVAWHVRARLGRLRNKSEAFQLRIPSDEWRESNAKAARRREGWPEDHVEAISPARWHELYWGASSGYPSIQSLADRFRVDRRTITKYLKRAGVQRRSQGEQTRFEIQMGRLSRADRDYSNCGNPAFFGGKRPDYKSKSFRDALRRGHAGEKVDRHRCCWWCGLGFLRDRVETACCSRSCGASMWRWKKKHSHDEPRPLIVERLRELLRQEPYKPLPFTRETVVNAGATIGAQESEILEVLTVRGYDDELLMRVINAPPMVRGTEPKKPREKPAIRPESLGAVGEAMLRAEKKRDVQSEAPPA